jgi:hypothetical protein
MAGCSGGAGNEPAPVAAKPPRIAGLGAISVDQDTTSTAVVFRIDDDDNAASQLTLQAASSDLALLPLQGIQIEGTGNDRSLRIRPAVESTGSAIVTLTVRDPSGLTATASFDVRVNPVLVSFKSLATDAFQAAPDGAAGKVAGVTVQSDVDDDPAAFDALLQAGEQ